MSDPAAKVDVSTGRIDALTYKVRIWLRRLALGPILAQQISIRDAFLDCYEEDRSGCENYVLLKFLG